MKVITDLSANRDGAAFPDWEKETSLHRGFDRLLLVAAIVWYSFGAIYLGFAWNRHFATQRQDLARCVSAVHNPGSSNIYVSLNEAGCQEAWGVHGTARRRPDNEIMATLFIVMFPIVMNGIVRLFAWICRG